MIKAFNQDVTFRHELSGSVCREAFNQSEIAPKQAMNRHLPKFENCAVRLMVFCFSVHK